MLSKFLAEHSSLCSCCKRGQTSHYITGCFLHCDLAAAFDSLDVQSRAKMPMVLVMQVVNSRWRGFRSYRFEAAGNDAKAQIHLAKGQQCFPLHLQGFIVCHDEHCVPSCAYRTK
ncbi:hypothetical protein V6N13_113423 [Hibiscus sabdariffa]|uniref:Reverse transcriptase domain-containing protein n=1 Tax=Hibiscus sabdariffa TaxID=183260 RepID=A0ABR2CUN5_9ROSI